ncbi:MAG: oxidoreductase [Acidiferrobacteraceae bacterium]|nr:oxidoreductase [Acidiferrobacteraceae bacterium]
MSSRVRVAVIGVGHLGSFHAEAYSRMSDVELVGLVDIEEPVVSAAASKHNCEVFSPGESLLGRVDAVSIAVPTPYHRIVAEPILADGIPALIEKPIAHSLEDARAIVQCAELSGTILQVGHIERFNAGVIRLSEELDQPRFIEVHRLGAFVERASDVDVVTDLMIHDIDIVLSLVSAELKYVSAVGAQVITGHVDIANARLEFENGAIANVTASRVSQNTFRRIRVFGQTGYLALNFQDQQIDVSRPGEPPKTGGFAPMLSETINVMSRPPLDAELEHFIECVRTGQAPLVSGLEGVRALEVAHQVRARIAASL